MNKYDAANFSPITEEMSKQLSARTNQFMNNSSLRYDQEYEDFIDNDSKYNISLNKSKKQKDVNLIITDEFDMAQKTLDEDIKIAEFASSQTPIEKNKHLQTQDNRLKEEYTENDLSYADMIILNHRKKNKSKTRSSSPKQNNIIKQSYNQVPNVVPNIKTGAKKKKHRVFIQEQPFKVDVNTKSSTLQQYNPLQDRFLKGFFTQFRLKNLKRIDKPKNLQNKVEKNGRNSPIPIQLDNQIKQNNPKQKEEYIQQIDEQLAKISIESHQLAELYDCSKDINSQASQFYSATQANLNTKQSDNPQLSVDMYGDNSRNKENININLYNQARNQIGSQKSVRSNKKTDGKYKILNKSSDFILQQQLVDNINSSSPMHSNQQNQNNLTQPILNPLNDKQRLPRIISANSPLSNIYVNSGFNSSSSSYKDKNMLVTQSQDLDVSQHKKKKKQSNQLRKKFHSIYSSNNNRAESPIYNKQSNIQKPFCNLNGISVALPKPNKQINTQTKKQVHLLLPSFQNQNQQTFYFPQQITQNQQQLTLSSKRYDNIDLSFQEKVNNVIVKQQQQLQQQQQQQQLQQQQQHQQTQPQQQLTQQDKDLEKNQYNIQNEMIVPNDYKSNRNNKLSSSLTKDEFNNFIDNFKRKYSPVNTQYPMRSSYNQQETQGSFESKLYKEHKRTIDFAKE